MNISFLHGGPGPRHNQQKRAPSTPVPTAIDRARPKIHVCGHIHGGYGMYEIERLSVKVINASNCDEEYRAVNPPIVVEWRNRPDA